MRRVAALLIALSAGACGHEIQDDRAAAVDVGDEQPPVWLAEPSLHVSELTSRSVLLTWSQAHDDSGRVAYRVLLDGTHRASVRGQSHRLLRLLPGVSHLVEIEPIDPAGNAASMRARASFTTSTACSVTFVPIPARIAP
jgi:hypothetical protein